MKILFSLFFLLFLNASSYAQDFSIEWGELERASGQIIYLIPNKKNEFYALRWAGGNILGSYQVSKHVGFEIVAKKKIKLVAENSIANFEGARVINGQFVVFLSDKRDNQNHLFIQSFDDNLEPNEEPQRIASFDLDKSRKKGFYDIIQSPNKKLLGVVWEIPGKKDENDIYGFKIYDKDLNIVNDGEYPLPFHPKLSTIHSHHISNKGDYFLALTEYEEKADSKSFKAEYDYKALHIFHINEDGLDDFILDLKEKRVEAMTLSSNAEDILTITGIYGEKEQQGVLGIFYQRINLKNGEVVNEGFQKFDESFVTQDWSEREKKKAAKKEEKGKGVTPQLYNYRMKEITVLSDGSIIGTMEQFYIRVQSDTDYRLGTSTQTYYYYYNDIIVFKIDQQGSFSWVKKVKKSQASVNDEGSYSSFVSFVANNQIYFIFNDNLSNYTPDGNFIDEDDVYTATYSRKRNTVAIAGVDLTTGEVNRRTFFDREEIGALAVPRLFSVNYRTNEMILYSIWGRKEKIGIMRF